MKDLICDLLSAASHRKQFDVFDVAANALAALRCKNDAHELPACVPPGGRND
jgi:hypothetical protein